MFNSIHDLSSRILPAKLREYLMLINNNYATLNGLGDYSLLFKNLPCLTQ